MSLLPLRLVAVAWLTSAVCLLSAPSASAQLLLNDGLENTIDMASPDLEVRDGPGPGSDPTTLFVVDGAVVAEQDDLSIAVFENSILQMSGGETAGGVSIADQALAVVSGGAIAGEVLVEGNARFELSGDGTLENDVAVEGTAQFEMTGGTIEGEIALGDDAIGVFFGGTLEDTLAAEGNAVVTVNFVVCEDNVEAADDAVVHLLGGEFEGSLEAVDAAVMQIAGGSFPAVFSDGEEVLASGGGTIQILGGEFGVAGEENDEGGIIATLGSVVNYSGATIAGIADGNAPTARFSAVLNGQVNLNNGAFGNLALAAGNNGTLNVGDVTADEVTVATLAGGTVNFEGGTADTLEIFAELGSFINLRGGDFAEIDLTLVSNSVLTIFGHSFTYLGTPVESLPPGAFLADTGELRTIGGDLSGILADGSPFSMTYSRQFNPAPGARVYLVQVPEPGTGVLAFTVLIGLVAGWRRCAVQA